MSPANAVRRSVKWVLVAHSVALFSFLTVTVAMDRYWASAMYIDGREFPGTDGTPPGPVGYDFAYFNAAPSITIYYAMFPLNQWLADGLLVCSILISVACVPHMVHPPSYTVAMSSFP